MKFSRREEGVLEELTALYKSYGFKRYKPGCFEEYALYQENKDFLIGKNVISFSDLSGKLMAMRPDVTLSLIKHNDVDEGVCEKFFYNEKVYRQASGSKNYKEINQLGVEVVGKVDFAVTCELTIMICKSLSIINDNFVLDISHMQFTESLLNEFNFGDREVLSGLLKSKNLHDFYKLAKLRGYTSEKVNAFEVAVKCGGNNKSALKQCAKAALNDGMRASVQELEQLVAVMEGFGYANKININFSAVNNADYYNGIIFNGYVQGIPHCVLSGGRYDKLLEKLGKKGQAIGFALYFGEIERYLSESDDAVDFLIIYDGGTQLEALKLAQRKLTDGYSVRISTKIPVGLTYKNLCDLSGKGAKK